MILTAFQGSGIVAATATRYPRHGDDRDAPRKGAGWEKDIPKRTARQENIRKIRKNSCAETCEQLPGGPHGALDGLYVPAGAPWLADFSAGLLGFPARRHDDQVDAIGLVGQLLDQMAPPAKPKPPAKPVRDSWDRPRPNDASSKVV